MLHDIKPGDFLVATEDAYYPRHISPEGNYSQRKGDVIMVNLAQECGYVQGTGIRGTAYNGRNILGLGSSLNAGTYRRATPDDLGYMATREQWAGHMRRLKVESFVYGVVALLALGALALRCLP